MDFAVPRFVNQLSDSILLWANPSLSNENRVTKDWPLVSLGSALAVVVAYMVFVGIGKFVMQSIYGSTEAPSYKGGVLQKFKKEPILLLAAIYNPAQVILCAYMIYAAVVEYIRVGYKPICNAFDATQSGMASVLWIFYVSKVFDFMDTFFIVMRRKWKQLIFLHLYHHSSIFLMYWLNVNAGYDGDIYFTIILNSFIHFVMYSYYEATTFNITVPKMLKKLVTNMQRIQFLMMNTQAIYILVMGCAYPRKITCIYLVYIISLFYLFTQFSNREYSSPPVGKKTSPKQK